MTSSRWDQMRSKRRGNRLNELVREPVSRLVRVRCPLCGEAGRVALGDEGEWLDEHIGDRHGQLELFS